MNVRGLGPNGSVYRDQCPVVPRVPRVPVWVKQGQGTCLLLHPAGPRWLVKAV